MVALRDVLYSRQFYHRQRGGSLSSAEVVLPLVFDLLHPASVLDVGCGVGTWLAVARKLGATATVGYDGPHVRQEMMIDNAIDLHRHDLNAFSFVGLLPRVDLAMSLEFAEHVSAEAGDRLVKGLCEASDAVLFGAAIPGQLGRGHINEQWPSYWMARFAAEGYAAYDIVRPECWNDQRVDVWYAQNTFLYLNTSNERTKPLRYRLNDQVARNPDAVNPRLWQARATEPTLRVWLRQAAGLPILRRFTR